MPQIQVLDQITIDKIAAGEVIERPASRTMEAGLNGKISAMHFCAIPRARSAKWKIWHILHHSDFGEKHFPVSLR